MKTIAQLTQRCAEIPAFTPAAAMAQVRNPILLIFVSVAYFFIVNALTK